MINQLKNREKATKNQIRRIKKENYKEAGITLLALVVTIIVLLILAGITMYFVLGQNGLLNRVQHASNTWANATADEDTMMGQFSNDVVSLTAGFIENGDQGQGEDDDYDGISAEWREILGRATKHPDQDSLNEDIGVGTDGNPVNLDLWGYYIDKWSESDGITLSGDNVCEGDAGYDVSKINGGQIQGKVPQYIKLAGKSKFLPVRSLEYTFQFCEDLEVAPEIPDTVTEMIATFRYCPNLREAPEIPEGVTDLSQTFWYCESLEVAPEIPEGVTSLQETFFFCMSLRVAPEIPESVTDMYRTFCGCYSLATPPSVIPSSVSVMPYAFYRCYALTGEMAINATNASNCDHCFEDAATNQNCDLILSGTCPELNNILKTKSYNSKIRIAQ